MPARKEWGRDIYGVGGEKFARLCTAARQTPEDPLTPEAVLERMTKTQTGRVRDKGRKKSELGAYRHAASSTHTCLIPFFSASPFHGQNT